MKKVILFAAILFSSISIMSVQAQVDAKKQGTANLTLNLHAVQSIKVDGHVVIDYLTADDYLKGKDSNSSTELTVISAGGFVIRVEAEELTGGAKDIKASTIAVTATAGAGGTGTFDDKGTLVKGETKKALITSTKGGVGKKYNVSYKGAGANDYMENYNAADAENGTQVYTTVVTYTIAAN